MSSFVSLIIYLFLFYSTVYYIITSEDVCWNRRNVKSKSFFFPEMHLYFIMFITAVCSLFPLNGDVIYRHNDDNNDEEDDDEDKHFISQATALKQTAS